MSDLIPRSAYTSGLAASAIVEYDSVSELFDVTLIISIASSGQVYKDYAFYVKPLNPPA